MSYTTVTTLNRKPDRVRFLRDLEAAVWAMARKNLLGAMGCMVNVEASKPEPVK